MIRRLACFLRLYMPFMRLAHRYGWHHMTVCYPDRDVMHWCHWCGLRVVETGDLLDCITTVGPTETPFRSLLPKTTAQGTIHAWRTDEANDAQSTAHRECP